MCGLFLFSFHAHAPHADDKTIFYVQSARGKKMLIYRGNRYIRNNAYNDKVYWKCTRWHSGCKGRAITTENDPQGECVLKNEHLHGPIVQAVSGPDQNEKSKLLVID